MVPRRQWLGESQDGPQLLTRPFGVFKPPPTTAETEPHEQGPEPATERTPVALAFDRKLPRICHGSIGKRKDENLLVRAPVDSGSGAQTPAPAVVVDGYLTRVPT